MKKLGCACVALSALLCTEQGLGLSDTIKNVLREYENYAHQTKRTKVDRDDTIERYKTEMETFDGTNFEVSDDGTKLNIFSVIGNSKILLESKENKTDSWFAYDFNEGKLLWYRNSLILWNANAKDNYSFLADRVYTFGDLNCNKLTIGAREGFMNFADINASHIKVFAHAGQDCGSITTSSKDSNRNSSYDEHLVEEFIGNYGNNMKILNTAFNDGWKSVGSLKSKSVVFESLDANIHGSLNAESVTMKGKRFASEDEKQSTSKKKPTLKSNLLIGNPYISEDFSNTWLDWLRSKEVFKKANVNIKNLGMKDDAKLTIPNAEYDDEKNYVNWEGSWRKIIIEKISGAEVEACLGPDEINFVDFLTNRIKDEIPIGKRSKGFHLKLTDKSTFDRDEGDVVVICGTKGTNFQKHLHYKKVKTSNNENYQFFDKDSSCRFSPDEEKKLKYHLVDYPVQDDNNGNGGNGGGGDDDDDDTPKKLSDSDDNGSQDYQEIEEEEEIPDDVYVAAWEGWFNKFNSDEYKKLVKVSDNLLEALKGSKDCSTEGQVYLYRKREDKKPIIINIKMIKKGDSLTCYSGNRGDTFDSTFLQALRYAAKNDTSATDNNNYGAKPEPEPEKQEVKKEQNQPQKKTSKKQKTFDSLEEFVNATTYQKASLNFSFSSSLISGMDDDLSKRVKGTIDCNVCGQVPGLRAQRIEFERDSDGKWIFRNEKGEPFSQEVTDFLKNVHGLQGRRNNLLFDTNDSEGAPKPEKRDITKKQGSEADLSDPTVKQMDDWAIEKLKQTSGHNMAAEMRGAQKLNGILKNASKSESVEIIFHNDNLPAVRLNVSLIKSKDESKFVFFTTENNKKLSESAQNLLNKMANAQKNFNDEKVARIWGANKVQMQAIKIDAGINKKDKEDSE